MNYQLILRKIWKPLAALFMLAAVTGCTSNSNTFDKSPCACDFKPANTGDFKDEYHA